MEVPTIRRKIMNVPKVFAKIATFLKVSLGMDTSREATDDYIEEVCSLYVELYLLLDYLFYFT